jgi:hypothetical protein
MANQTIQDSLQLFYQTKFVTNRMISSESFETQINLIMEQFKRTVPESFQRTLNLLKTNFENNLFITPMNSRFEIYDIKTNAYVQLDELNHYAPKIPSCKGALSPLYEFECFCIPSSFRECPRNTVLSEGRTRYNISGMFQSWFPLQSLLMSTLECFYNNKCLSQITQYINSTVSPINFTTLKSSSDQNQTDTIESLANNLFIQSWNNESSFQSYFNHCHPLTCEYTYESRPDFIYIVTTIIGVIGGVNIFLSLLLPYIVKLVASIWNYVLQRQRGQINTVVEPISMKTRKKLCEKFF